MKEVCFMSEEMRSFGYLCPECGKTVLAARSVFALELAILAEKEKQQKESEGPETFVDNVIMYEVLSELKDIAARDHGITCACGSSRYGMEIRRSSVDLVCRDCGAKLRIPAATDRDLDDLCCHMKLVIPGKGV